MANKVWSLSYAKEDRQLKNYFMERHFFWKELGRGAAGTLFRVDWNN